MSLENIPDPNHTEELSGSAQFPVNGWWRIIYGLFVIVLPAFSFWAIQGLKPEWQSGDLQDYLALLLSAEASLIFLFLLAYSILCYSLLLIAPNRFAEFFLIRFGIYGGVLLALQYSIVLFLHLFDNKYIYAIFLLWLFPLYFPRFYRWALEKWVKRYVRAWMLLVVAILYGILTFVYNDALLPILLAFIGMVASAPFWSFLIAGQAALWLFKNYETKFTLPRGLGFTAWLAAYAAAWRYDILKMYELYAQLPTAPPNCYIATAAANGHPKLVHSWTVQVQFANGKSMRANKQLQTLKCAELALMAVAPRLHKFVRKIYDVVGKSLAHKIQNPFLADVAYLLLKPFEWLARVLLRMTIPNIDSISKEIYGN